MTHDAVMPEHIPKGYVKWLQSCILKDRYHDRACSFLASLPTCYDMSMLCDPDSLVADTF